MKAKEYLDAAKALMQIESDYELAKRLESTPGHIAEMRSGKRRVALDIAYRLAIILKADPATVVADLEAEREKNPRRADFWRSFLARAAMVAILACTAALHSFATPGAAPAGAGSGRRLRAA